MATYGRRCILQYCDHVLQEGFLMMSCHVMLNGVLLSIHSYGVTEKLLNYYFFQGDCINKNTFCYVINHFI